MLLPEKVVAPLNTTLPPTVYPEPSTDDNQPLPITPPMPPLFNELFEKYAEDEDYYEGQPDTRFLSQLTRAEHDHIVNLRLISNDDRVAIMEATASKVVSKN